MKARWIIVLTGTVLLGACKRSRYESARTASADTVLSDSTTTTQIKLVKTAEINFKVVNVQQSSEKITTVVKGFKGMVMHRQTASEAVEKTDIRLNSDSVLRITSVYTTGNITVKIPSIQLDSFMYKVDHLALNVNNQSIDVTDKTLEYLSSSMKLRDRLNFANQQKRGRLIIKNPADLIQLSDDETDERISNSRINDMVHYSTVNLQFYQSNTINKEVIANDNVNAYTLPFLTRLSLALKSGWDMFIDLLVGLANIWVLLLIGVVGLLVYKRFKSHKPTVNTKA